MVLWIHIRGRLWSHTTHTTCEKNTSIHSRIYHSIEIPLSFSIGPKYKKERKNTKIRKYCNYIKSNNYLLFPFSKKINNLPFKWFIYLIDLYLYGMMNLPCRVEILIKICDIQTKLNFDSFLFFAFSFFFFLLT